jgi:hypothetical protein
MRATEAIHTQHHPSGPGVPPKTTPRKGRKGGASAHELQNIAPNDGMIKALDANMVLQMTEELPDTTNGMLRHTDRDSPRMSMWHPRLSMAPAPGGPHRGRDQARVHAMPTHTRFAKGGRNRAGEVLPSPWLRNLGSAVARGRGRARFRLASPRRGGHSPDELVSLVWARASPEWGKCDSITRTQVPIARKVQTSVTKQGMIQSKHITS